MLVRVVLDANIVRNMIEHEDFSLVDRDALAKGKDQVRISIGGWAFDEILEQLCRSSSQHGMFERWQKAAEKLTRVLDPRLPIFVASESFGALLGTSKVSKIDVAEERRKSQLFWQWISSVSCRAELESFNNPNSATFKCNRLICFNEDKRGRWIALVEQVKRLLVAEGCENIGRREVMKRFRPDFGSHDDDTETAMLKLKHVFDYLLWLASGAIERTPYNPKLARRRSDTFDKQLLMHLGLPAIVCTNDQAIGNILRDNLSSPKLSGQIINDRKLNEFVREGTLGNLVQHWKSHEEQHAEWQRAAYSQWMQRGMLPNDAWTDWFEAEPLM